MPVPLFGALLDDGDVSGLRWRVLAWAAAVVAAAGVAGLGAQVAIAGVDKASGLAAVIAGFCELAAFTLGVAGWASRRRMNSAGIGMEHADTVASAAAEGAGPDEARAGAKYEIDARGAHVGHVGDGGFHYADYRGLRPPRMRSGPDDNH